MNKVFRFKPHLRVDVVSGDQVFLIGEREQVILRGYPYGVLAPLVDGRRTVREVIDALKGAASPHEILCALMKLEGGGYIAEAVADDESAGFWGALQADAARLAETPISVEGVGGESAAPLREALALAGVRVEGGAATRILVTSDYLTPEIDAENRRALEEGSRWMLVKPTGLSAWIGPMFRPGDGPCWACLARRIRLNRPAQTFIEQRNRERPTLPRIGVGVSVRAAVDLAALCVARWVVESEKGVIDDRLLDVDLVGLKISEHVVVRCPQCSACGNPGLLKNRIFQPVVLESRPKRFTDDGGHRGSLPEETFARHAHLIDPITGVIAYLEPVQGRDQTLQPVYQAVYPICPVDDMPSAEDFLHGSAGKGRTQAQARTSALCEAIERLSAVSQGHEPRVRARIRDLGEEGVRPNDLLNFSDAQFDARAEINARVRDPRHAVPIRYEEQMTIDWTPAWSLTRKECRYLPAAYCYSHTAVPPEERICYFNPNGHAAGNSFEEAIVQGFLELVERDAVAIWWGNRLRRPSVDLRSFGDPYFLRLGDHYQSLGWSLWVLDLTHDLEIPAFTALTRRKVDGRFFAGFGCHLDARIGVCRALTELNQVFNLERRTPPPWDERAVGDASYLFPDEHLPPRARCDFPDIAHDDLRDDVRTCVERASRAGLETVVLDQTRPDLGLSAVKVIVPGLRHFWPRFGPGRLYDVPVGLGWRKRPLAETDINQVSIV